MVGVCASLCCEVYCESISSFIRPLAMTSIPMCVCSVVDMLYESADHATTVMWIFVNGGLRSTNMGRHFKIPV